MQKMMQDSLSSNALITDLHGDSMAIFELHHLPRQALTCHMHHEFTKAIFNIVLSGSSLCFGNFGFIIFSIFSNEESVKPHSAFHRNNSSVIPSFVLPSSQFRAEMAGRRQELLNQREWKDVVYINYYAEFMGYLSMAIRGLGFLVFTWTTVILLGGFVSVLQKKDFWSLTFITLVQIAGIFDVVVNEKLRAMSHSRIGLIKLLVYVILLWPMAVIYMFGIFMSGGISLWRLIEHDYGDSSNSDGGASNLEPAIRTLYYLGLIQCGIFCYKFILSFSEKNLTKEVATGHGDLEIELVSGYLHQTRNGCEKEPSFAGGRNLITYAIDMIGSYSPVDCISGVKFLFTAIKISEREMKMAECSTHSKEYSLLKDFVIGRRMLIKHLVLSSSSSRHTLQKLLETLDSRGLHDRETRNQAAMIVERLAFNINLEEFPRGIQYISSMFETFEQYCIAEPHQRDYLYDEQGGEEQVPPELPLLAGELGNGYKELVLQGLCILGKLATGENNCRVISNTRDLIPKIMSPVTSDLLDHTVDGHGAWYDIVEASMKVMEQLAGSPGEVGAKICHEISNCQVTISTLQRILSCSKCKNVLQLSAIRILTRLSRDTTESRRSADSVLKGESRANFVRTLVYIFTDDNKSIPIRECAGNALLEVLCFSGGSSDSTIVIKSSKIVFGDGVDGIVKVLKHQQNETCRKAAAEILKHLYTHYIKNDRFLIKLRKSVYKLLDETLGGGNDRGQGMSSLVQSVRSATFLSSLFSLSWTVHDSFVSAAGQHNVPEFNTSSFVRKLNEMVLIPSDSPSVEKLLLFKAIGEVVILMMRRSNGRFVKQEDLKSWMNALSAASKKMLDLDYSMVFSSTSSCQNTSLKLVGPTLESIVKEAQEIHDKMASTSSTSASG